MLDMLMLLYNCCTVSLSKKILITPTSLISAFCSLLACTVQRPAMKTTRRFSILSTLTILMQLLTKTGTTIATHYVLRKVSKTSLVNSQEQFLTPLSRSLLNIWSIINRSPSRKSSSNTIEATPHIKAQFQSSQVSNPSIRSLSSSLLLLMIRFAPQLKHKISSMKCPA